jgi:heme exporter protein C
MRTAERMIGKATARRGERILGWASLAALAATAVMSLVVAPPDASQGDVQRLMYIHVPAAWLAYLSFFIVFVSSIAYLWTRRTRWDRLAAASAEVGVLFTVLTIGLGMLWGKPVWGAWWTWDPRITTTSIMLLVYVAYLAVRRLPENPAKRARWAAVIGIVAFADIPIVQLSVTWWRSLHQGPTIRLLGESTIAPIMLTALLIGVGAFTILYCYLVALRLRVGRLEERAMAEALSPRLAAAAAPSHDANEALAGAGAAPGAPAPMRTAEEVPGA